MTPRRKYTAAKDNERCEVTVTLRDGTKARCMKRSAQLTPTFCVQHARQQGLMKEDNMYQKWSWTTDAPEPLRDALRLFCGGKEPPEYVQGYDYSNLTDTQHQQLQDWVNMNLADGIFWSTGIGVIEAAQTLVEEAVANANIPPSLRETEK